MNKAIFLPIIALGVMVFQKITNFQFSSQEVQIISDGALALAVFLMEYFIPYSKEYANPIPANANNILEHNSWPPFGKYL